MFRTGDDGKLNPLNADLNPICYLLVLLRAHHILHVSRIRVNHRFAAMQHLINNKKETFFYPLLFE
jgi:hypothetical protein